MKIGIDGRAAKWYRGTGIGTYTYQLINNLNKIDKDNNYMLFMDETSSSNFSFGDNFSIKNITKNNSSSFWDEVNIPNILKDTDMQLYHVPQNGVGLPFNKNCSCAITLHDVIPYKMPETVGDNYLKIFNEQMPKIVAACDGIITVSNYSKKDIIETFNIPENKVHVTHLAAEDIYRPMDKIYSKNLIDKYYSIPSDYILYIGGFSPRKNILGLIEAFSQLLPKINKSLNLIIAGTRGKSYEIYKNKVIELHLEGKVIFPGFIPIEHLPYLYSASEVFVYPSFYEGFGLPPIEAMSCGVPVIASNTTSIPEILGNSAYLIDPYNSYEICMSMYDVITNKELRNSLIKKGFNLSSSLSWEKTAFNTLKIYNNILNT